jgi:hypothetical protein
VTTVVEVSVVTPTVVELQLVDDEVTVGSTSPSTVEIAGVEAAGPRGPRGPQGEQGANGGSYRHVQNATAATWTVTHNLGYEPAVTAFDSGGTQVIGDIEHLTVNQLTITFASAFSGFAYLS